MCQVCPASHSDWQADALPGLVRAIPPERRAAACRPGASALVMLDPGPAAVIDAVGSRPATASVHRPRQDCGRAVLAAAAARLLLDQIVQASGAGAPGHKHSQDLSTVLIIDLVLMEVARWLRESGLEVEDHAAAGEADAGVDVVIDVTADGHSTRFAVQVKRRAPYPHEVERLERSWRERAGAGHPLMVAPFVSESLGSILTRAGWSWADDQGNFDLRAPGLLLRQRRTVTAAAPRRRSLPRGSGSFAIIRALVAFSDGEDEEPGATMLAAQVGVSQPRASQVLRHLHELDLVEKCGHGRWKPRREALLDRFLAEYPGPGGSEQHCYSLDSPLEVAIRQARRAARVTQLSRQPMSART